MVDESRSESPRSELPRSGRSRRRTIFKLAVAFLAFLMSFGAMELIARIALAADDDKDKSRSAYLSKWPRRLYTRDKILGKIQRPSVTVTTIDETGREVQFATDEHGLRIGTGESRSPIGKSVAVLGDSFIQAAKTPFDETFCEVLSTHLGCRTVYNLGVGGYSTWQAVDLGKRIVPKLDIDTVILAVFAGNDLRDNFLWTGRRVPVEVVEKSVLDCSALYRFIKDRSQKEVRTIFQGYDWNSHFDAELLLYDPALSSEDISKLEQAKAKSLASLEEFRALASRLDARPLIVFIPSKAMVYREPLFITCTTATPWAWDAMMGVSQRGYDFDQVRGIWQSLAEQAQLPFFDLTDEFRDNRHDSLYGKIDRHWSCVGQRIAAETVARYLEEHASHSDAGE